MLCYPHLYWVDRRELTSCHHYPDLGTPASYLLQWAWDEPSLTFYMELFRDCKWSPPSAEHHLTSDAASQTVSVSPTHIISAPLWHVRNRTVPRKKFLPRFVKTYQVLPRFIRHDLPRLSKNQPSFSKFYQDLTRIWNRNFKT